MSTRVSKCPRLTSMALFNFSLFLSNEKYGKIDLCIEWWMSLAYLWLRPRYRSLIDCFLCLFNLFSTISSFNKFHWFHDWVNNRKSVAANQPQKSRPLNSSTSYNKQGRLPKSRAGGQGSDKNGWPSIMAGAVMQKPLINIEKAMCYGPIEWPTDWL